MLEYRYGFLVWQFRLSETSYMQTDTDWMCLNYLYLNLVGSPPLSQEPWKGAKLRHWPVILQAILIERGVISKGADLKCKGKEPSVSNKLIIDVIGVIKMSMLSFTRLIGIGSKSEDWHGACTKRWRTSSPVTQLRFCSAFLVSGGFNTRECESQGKEERMTGILLMKNELNGLAKAAIEE